MKNQSYTISYNPASPDNTSPLIRNVTEGDLDQRDSALKNSAEKMLHEVPGQGMMVFDQENHKIQEVPLVSAQAVREYLEHLWKQYKKATKALRGEILSEICRNLGIHRKSATRLMTRKYVPRSLQGFKGGRPKRYSEKAKMHLERLWKAMGYMWPLRMKERFLNGFVMMTIVTVMMP